MTRSTRYAFVDGIGRTTQTKRDARLFQGAGVAPIVGRSVSGAVTFDALGRAVEQYYPTQDTQADATTYDTAVSAVDPQVTVFDLRDRPTSITEPGDRVTQFVYGNASLVTGGPVYGTIRETAPNQRATTTFVDARQVVRASDDKPLALPAALRTTFEHDAMGQMLRMTDTAGNSSTYEYDLLGRRVATTTPDGGEVQYGFDPEGKLMSKVTPNLRADGTAITYAYEFGRLTAIDHPDGTPDVSYTYGEPGDGINGAGRVVRAGGRFADRHQRVRPVRGRLEPGPRDEVPRLVQRDVRLLTVPDHDDVGVRRARAHRLARLPRR